MKRIKEGCKTCEYLNAEMGFCNWCTHGIQNHYQQSQERIKASLEIGDKIKCSVGSGMSGFNEYSGEIVKARGGKLYMVDKKNNISFPLSLCGAIEMVGQRNEP